MAWGISAKRSIPGCEFGRRWSWCRPSSMYSSAFLIFYAVTDYESDWRDCRSSAGSAPMTQPWWHGTVLLTASFDEFSAVPKSQNE